MQVAGGGRKRVRATRSASTTSDGSETAAAGTDAAAEAIVDAAADTATSPPTGDAAAVHSTSSYETAHIAAAHSAAPVAAAAAAVGAVDDGNGRGKRSKTRRGGATADTVKPEDSTATNGHSAPTTQTTDDDRHNATAGTVHAVSTVQPPVSTADGRDTAAIVRPATRSPSTTQSNPTTPLATQGHTHQVIHSDPPDPHSVPPAHPLNVGAVIPPLPTFPTSSRGYVAYFYWKHYPPVNFALPPLPNRPSYTELVPSIPTIFYKILAILSDNEYNLYEQEALAAMDKKLFKLTSPPPTVPQQHQPLHHVYHRHVLMHPTDVPVDELDATKLLLRDHKGGEYVVTACRKEHVRLLYETDASVLGRLGVCPLLLDVYSVQGGKKQLVGGAGNERRNRGGGDGWLCSCKEGAVPMVRKAEEGVVAPQPQPAVKLASAAKHTGTVKGEAKGEVRTDDVPNDESIGEEDEDVPMEHEQQTGKEAEPADGREKQEASEMDAAASAAAVAGTDGLQESAATDSVVPSSTVSPIHPFSSELDVSGSEHLDDELLLANELLTPVNSTPGVHPTAGPTLAATPTSSSASSAYPSSYQPPSHIVTAFSSTSQHASELDRERHKRKLSLMQRQLSSVSDQLKSVSAMSNMWEAKYKEEKDVNEKLWARIVQVQRQLRQMSRPLTTALASQGRL